MDKNLQCNSKMKVLVKDLHLSSQVKYKLLTAEKNQIILKKKHDFKY